MSAQVMRRFVSLGFGIFLFLCGTESANAGCGVREQVVFAPRTGTRIGPNPTLWLFLPQGARHNDGTLFVQDAKGTPVSFELEATPTGAVPVVQLKVKVPRGAITVSFGKGPRRSLAHYTIDNKGPQLRSAALVSPSVVEAKYIYGSGCGSSNAFIVHVLPKADVYQIRDGSKTWLVPDLSADYSVSDGHGVLTVGHIACSEFTLPFDNPVNFDWIPLWSNGVRGLTYLPFCRHIVPPGRDSEPFNVGIGIECTSGVQLEFGGRVTQH